MRLKLLFSICTIFIWHTAMFGQCPAGQNTVRLELFPDQFYTEISWRITNLSGSVVYANGECTSPGAQSFEYCVDASCLVFRIADKYGDGMVPDGHYAIFYNDTLVHENIGGDYNWGENVAFGCAYGTYCNDPIPIDTGLHVSPSGEESWYRFVPQDTGIYRISTCDTANHCPSKIWAYDRCIGITVSNDQTGAVFYSDGGCDAGVMGAKSSLYLAGGKEYFIRIAYAQGDCDNSPIHFDLHYVGPISGCTDPLACNYNPLASVSDTCIYPGNPACPNAPDLLAREDILRNSMALDYLDNGDECYVKEGCIKGTGIRSLIRFSTEIDNIGNQDYFIGAPPTDINAVSDQFVWDACHNHWHYRGYAEYILFDTDNGTRIPIGSKNGFCVLDLGCPPDLINKYTCNNMGITAGCHDTYDAALPCQWVDITEMAPGNYTLVMRVNWDKSPDKLGRIEKDFNNNWAQACFSLHYDNAGEPLVEFLQGACPPYVDCQGTLFGDAEIDCEGNCAGPVLRGDWNKDTVRNDTDVQLYLDAALADNADPTTCRDLYADGQIDVYDAAVLQECSIHANDVAYWGVRYPCQFPTGVFNETDMVKLLPGSLDTLAKTFTVQVVNPFNKIMGYEFSVSGLKISSVENLETGYNGAIQFDSTGEIISLAADESLIKKTIQPAGLVRIHYSELTAPTVCISGITAIVNANYHKSGASIVNPACVPSGWVSATNEPEIPYHCLVQPNPFSNYTTLFFTNPDLEPLQVTVTDMTGRVLRSFPGIREESLRLEQNNMPSGIYYFTVSGKKGSVSGKMVVE